MSVENPKNSTFETKKEQEGEKGKEQEGETIAQIKEKIDKLEKEYDDLYPERDKYSNNARMKEIDKEIKKLEENLETKKEQEGEKEKQVKEEEKSAEAINLEEKRNNYAQLVNRSRRFFNRPEKKAMEKARKEYEEALKNKTEKTIKELEEKIEKLGLTDEELNELEIKVKNGEELPEKPKEYQRLITEFALFQQNEQTKLMEAMENPEDKTLADKFKKFWLRHGKLRMILSSSLLGVGVISTATGFVPGILAAGAGRAALAGPGTAMMTAGIWDGVRSKWGAEKNIKGIDYKKYKEMSKKLKKKEMTYEEMETEVNKDIEKLDTQEMFKDVSQAELKDRYTALMTRAAERGALGSLKKEITFQAIQKELTRREEVNIQEKIKEKIKEAKEKKQGEEEALIALLGESLDNQKEALDFLQTRQQKRRTNNIAKWITAATAGGLMAYFVGSATVESAEAVQAKVEAAAISGAEPTPEVTPDQAQEISNVVKVEQEDNLYKIVSNELDKEGAFEELNALKEKGEINGAEFLARKESMIMNTIEEIKDNPSAYGISSGDANIIHPGEELNFSTLITQEHIADIQQQAAELTESQIENINNVVEAHESFAGSLTPDNIEKIDSAIESLGDKVDILKDGGSFNPEKLDFAIDNPEMSAEQMEKVFDFGDKLEKFKPTEGLDYYQNANELISQGAEIEGSTLRLGDTIVDIEEGNLYNKNWVSPFSKEPMKIPLKRIDMNNINNGQFLLREVEEVSADMEKEVLSITNGETVKSFLGLARNKINPEELNKFLAMDFEKVINSSPDQLYQEVVEDKLPGLLAPALDKRSKVIEKFIEQINKEIAIAGIDPSSLEQGTTVAQILDKAAVEQAKHIIATKPI